MTNVYANLVQLPYNYNTTQIIYFNIACISTAWLKRSCITIVPDIELQNSLVSMDKIYHSEGAPM
jgi:hypothetical protein